MLTALVASLVLAAPALESDQLSTGTQLTRNYRPKGVFNPDSAGGVLGRTASGGVLGIDSVVNFQSYFYEGGLAFSAFGSGVQFTWGYSMVGRQPFGEGDSDHTTRISAPVIPVIMDLRNFDGTPRFVNGQRLISNPTKYVQPVLQSPIFQNFPYSSSERPTQFTDAVHRAQFYKMSDDDWHTVLKPSVKQPQTMVLIRGTYRFALNADGTCCEFILVDYITFLNALYPSTIPVDNTSVIGAAELSGDMTTEDITTLLFPDTYLFDSNGCCIIGFHNYDLEPGDASNGFRERRYVFNYSAYVAAPVFGPSFGDITPLSHELAEIFADPFINNATPIWLAPNGNCQNNLEVGDVVENLPNETYPISINGMTYHPQNVALVQWFAGQTPSNAKSHAYSYPDTTVLTSAAVSLLGDCATPFPYNRTR